MQTLLCFGGGTEVEMRIHTSLTRADMLSALQHVSRTHERAFEVRLTGTGPDSGTTIPVWREMIAEVEANDPGRSLR